MSRLNLKLTTFLLLLLLLLSLALSGCGGGAKTTGYYKTPFVPVEVKLSRQANGLWTAGGGLATPVGTFGIEQTFDTRAEFTYLVLRDRARGTDQVFKLATRGYVEFHMVGEHRMRVDRQDNKLTVDVDTLAGSFDFKVYPDSEAVARVEFGDGEPDFVVFNDRRLAVDYQSILWENDWVSLDSVEKVVYRKGYRDRALVFHWKPEVRDQPPFEVSLGDWPSCEKNFQALHAAVGEFAPHVRFERGLNAPVALTLWVSLGLNGLLALSMLGLTVYNFLTSAKHGWGCLGLFGLCGSLVACAGLLFVMALDWDFVASYLS